MPLVSPLCKIYRAISTGSLHKCFFNFYCGIQVTFITRHSVRMNEQQSKQGAARRFKSFVRIEYQTTESSICFLKRQQMVTQV